jgi:hypothetical protein
MAIVHVELVPKKVFLVRTRLQRDITLARLQFDIATGPAVRGKGLEGYRESHPVSATVHGRLVLKCSRRGEQRTS